jgi:predicted Zn-dependent protease
MRALLAALLLAGSTGAMAAAPGDAPNQRDLAYRFFDTAEQCFGKRDLACALEQVRKALITDPDLRLAQVLLGKVLLEGGTPPAPRPPPSARSPAACRWKTWPRR